jgi:phosphodiesterase/alkaline phosphatase D-like protein
MKDKQRNYFSAFPLPLLAGWLLLLPTLVSAQIITHGPAVGAVGPDSARVYVRTNEAQAFILEVATDPGFSQIVASINDSTRAERDSSVIVTLRDLLPKTQYYLRYVFGGVPDALQATFRTFPTVGSRDPLVIATGSCQETANMNVFLEIPKHDPDLFIHLGDWTYPSYQLPDAFYPEDWSYVQLSWRRKYAEVNMDSMMRLMAMDYIHDDDDFVEGGSIRNHYVNVRRVTDSSGVTRNVIENVAYPDSLRQTIFRAYHEFYPHYALVDTAEGLFHSYRIGNVEVFFCDVRSTATPFTGALKYDSIANSWFWDMDPYPGHTMLRPAQFDWLKQGLKNSTADWKILATGAVFNKGLKRLIDLGLANQTFQAGNYTGFNLASGFAGEWVGYPESQMLLDWLAQENIRDVIAISGQSHVNAVDDGTNAGIPEVNASGLSVADADRQLLQLLNGLTALFGAPNLRDSLWNGGGVGLGPGASLKNGFGKLAFYGNDSARLSVVDEDGVVMGQVRLIHSSKVTSRPDATKADAWFEVLYPNPTDGQLTLRFAEGFSPATGDYLRLSDPLGRTLTTIPLSPMPGEQTLRLPELSAATYQVAIVTRYGTHRQAIVVR